MSLSYYETIDDFLGCRETRYFGSGYVNTTQLLSGFELAADDAGIDFSGMGAVLLPPLWSAKGGSRQKPHLSSIDAIELAVQCLARVARHVFPERPFSVEMIRQLDVIAGKEPVEEDLEALPFAGRVRFGTTGPALLEMSISNMKVNLQFALEEPVGPLAAGHEKQPVRISDLLLHPQHLKASAVVSPDRQNAAESWSLSSCFASALQVGQVLLYKLDSLSRESSNTLWMRKTSIGVSSGVPALGMPQPIYTKLDKVKKLMMDGADWRCADISSLMCNTRIVCSVAHRI